MIRLGHIEYSNCFPVHAQLVGGAAPSNIEIVAGTPAELNAALAERRIDVAPCSSIEYARNAGSYRLLPEFVIASDGAVGSILFESTLPLGERANAAAWADATVAVPTASATSVVLLRILLQLRFGIQARFEWFNQSDSTDPIARGHTAALWIGDVALRRSIPARHLVYDLGAEWKEWTGLPFVFAAWQTSAPREYDAELHQLVTVLKQSRAWFVRNADELAREFAPHFRMDAGKLLAYWQSLRYCFDEPMQRGLLEYYRLAAQLGEAAPVERLRWL